MTNDPQSPSLPPDSGQSKPDGEPALEPASGPSTLPESAPVVPPAVAAAPPPIEPSPLPYPQASPVPQAPPTPQPSYPQAPGQAWNRPAPWSPQAQWSGPGGQSGSWYTAGASSRPRRPRSPAAWVATGAAAVLIASFFLPWASFRIAGGAFSFDYSTSLISMISDDLATFDIWLICLMLGTLVAVVGSLMVVSGSSGTATKVALGGFAAAAIGAGLGIAGGFGGGFMDAITPAFGPWLAVLAAGVGAVASAVLIVSPNYGIPAARLAPTGPWQPSQGLPSQPWRVQGPASYIPAVYSPPPPSYGSPTQYAPPAAPSAYAPPPSGSIPDPAPTPPSSVASPEPMPGYAPSPAYQPPMYPQPPMHYPAYPPAPMYAPPVMAGLDNIPGRLVVVDGGSSTVYSVAPGHGFTVGREAGCSLVFTDPSVGERQVAIERRGDGWLIQNVDPARPTLVVDSFGRHQPVEWELGLRSGQLSIGTAMVLLYPVMG